MSRTLKRFHLREESFNGRPHVPLCVHCGLPVDKGGTTYGNADLHRRCLRDVQEEWERVSPPDDDPPADPVDDDDDDRADDLCPSCNGTGSSHDGMSPTGSTCETCGGSGDHTRPWR